MDNKQRKKLARAQTRQIIVGILKNFTPKNCWNFIKEHWKEFLVAGGATLGGATFAGCVPKDNPPAIVQPSGDHESGDINSGEITSGEEKPGDIGSGDIGSGDIGSGEEKPGESGDNNPGSGEENPGEETKYPSTIAEMTDEQKKILTDYLDEKYLSVFAKSSGIIGANIENTKTIGYTLNKNRVAILLETINDAGKYIYSRETNANIEIERFFKAIDDKQDPSEFAKFTFENYIKSDLFLIPLTENEFSAYAENAYKKTINKFNLEDFSNESSDFKVMRKSTVVAHDGTYDSYELTAITTTKDEIIADQLFIVPKGNLSDYVERDVDVEYRDHRRKTLIFKISENTVLVTFTNQTAKE